MVGREPGRHGGRRRRDRVNWGGSTFTWRFHPGLTRLPGATVRLPFSGGGKARRAPARPNTLRGACRRYGVPTCGLTMTKTTTRTTTRRRRTTAWAPTTTTTTWPPSDQMTPSDPARCARPSKATLPRPRGSRAAGSERRRGTPRGREGVGNREPRGKSMTIVQDPAGRKRRTNSESSRTSPAPPTRPSPSSTGGCSSRRSATGFSWS